MALKKELAFKLTLLNCPHALQLQYNTLQYHTNMLRMQVFCVPQMFYCFFNSNNFTITPRENKVKSKEQAELILN